VHLSAGGEALLPTMRRLVDDSWTLGTMARALAQPDVGLVRLGTAHFLAR